MTDTDTPQELPLVYGVWIEGEGWLRDKNRNIFADMRKDLADDARMMYRGVAQVVLIDESMIALEPLFLDREKRAKKQHDTTLKEIERASEAARPVNKLKRWINVLLRPSHN